MASKKGSKKYYPCVKTAPVSSGAAANTLVDTARQLSVLNRRLYRFGRYYECKIDIRNDTPGQISVFVLRDDWAVQKVFQMAYKQYLKNTADERGNLAKGQVARWEDFRVEHGLTLAINEARPVMHQPGGGSSVLNQGEFALSNVVDGSGNEMTFTWGAGSAGSKFGILEEYAKIGDAQDSPENETPSAPYVNIDTQVDEATHDNLQLDGDQPPYERNSVNETVPWVRVAVLGQTAGAQKLSTGFFTAPCGLVLLAGHSDTGSGYPVTLSVKSGDYKGVHAPSMLE